MNFRKEAEKRLLKHLGTHKGVVVGVNGSLKAVNPENGTDFCLQELQKIVGGYIEIVYVIIDDVRYMLICNEDGFAQNLEGNIFASIVYNSYVVGDVLICSTEAIK